MNTKRSKKELIKRYFVFLIGLFVSSFGIAFVTKANLGTSPISSIPYTLSIGLAPTLGMFTLYMSIILVILQLLLLRKNFPKHYFLQIPVSFLFSYFIDLSMNLLHRLNPTSYPLQIIALLLGCAILGFGVFLEVLGDAVMLPGESFVNAVSKTFHTDFGYTKVGFDTTCTVSSVIIAFAMYHRLEGVREGTIVAAFLVGMIARFLLRKFKFVEEKWIVDKEKTISTHTVITVGREFGSGGRKTAAMIAEELGLAFHDTDIVFEAAKELGIDEDLAERDDQKLKNRLLYDLYAQWYEQSETQQPLQDDLFKKESEIIRRYATTENCVIVGRCADVVCRDLRNTCHIFLFASEEYKVQEIVRREALAYGEAADKVREINKERANHYHYFTGETWGEAERYDLYLNSELMSQAEILAQVRAFCKDFPLYSAKQ